MEGALVSDALTDDGKSGMPFDLLHVGRDRVSNSSDTTIRTQGMSVLHVWKMEGVLVSGHSLSVALAWRDSALVFQRQSSDATIRIWGMCVLHKQAIEGVLASGRSACMAQSYPDRQETDNEFFFSSL